MTYKLVKTYPMFVEMPKIDLHRHLEGSLRLSTLQEIASQFLPTLLPNLHTQVQIQEKETASALNFLAKFRALRKFYLSMDLVNRFVSECIQDAAAEGLVYLELRFSPAALTQSKPELISEVISCVVQSAEQASAQFVLPLGLIVCINRHESVELAEKIVDCAVPFRSQGIVGIDLTGDEMNFSAMPFQRVLQKAKATGLALTIHAGEWGSAGNIEEAITQLSADRIGHGVRIMEDQRVLNLARERKIPFEVCLTSNIQSGIFTNLESHPIQKMLAAGLNVTINSDDPQVSKITLSNEIENLVESFGFNMDQIQKLMLAAINASFLPATDQQIVRSNFLMRYKAWLSKA